MQLSPIAPAPALAGPKAPTPTAPTPAPVDDWLDPNVAERRLEAGRAAERAPEIVPPSLIGAKAPAYFRTVDQVNAAIRALDAKYPDLVEVHAIGKSGEGRDILALTITNEHATGPKPIVEHVAGLHAREIANPELLMTFAQQLVEGYGKDADVTSILDTRQVDLVPIVNPDGHVVVEKGLAGQPGGNAMKRKTTSGGDGTDVNRNFQYHWGGPGASSSPRAEDYRGPAAESEPETRAVESFTQARKPSMFTDWHSYSRLDMYPWGDTKEHAPDYAGLKAVANKFATFNHYTPEQSIALYPTSGTSDDHAYGAYHVPAWAIETGDSFIQSDKEFASTLKENLPVLYWGAKAADDPYAKAAAADASDVVVDPAKRTLSARIAAPADRSRSVVAAEAVLDPAAAPGTGLALSLATEPAGQGFAQATGDLSALPAARDAKAGAMVYVRAKDSAGAWGPLTAQWLVAPTA
jgi:hypothetical protein